MATGEAWFKVPESIKFVFHGELPPYVGGKDLILRVIGDIGVDGARYMAMEFTGPVINSLSMDNRFTMANMAIEAGGKNGIFAPDEITLNYVKGRNKREYSLYYSDADARYVEIREYNVTGMEPIVAVPHLPENTRGISEVGEVRLDQVVIGSCTNGRIEDLRIAAGILKGQKVARGVRCIVLPATPATFLSAEQEGLIRIFLESGAIVGPPTCGPCLGGHMGILAEGEKALATTNRNFVGRMGHTRSEIYLASPAIAAASAITGKISSPAEVLS